MYRRFIRFISFTVCAALTACASGPATEGDSAAAAAVNVDERTRAEYQLALNAMQNGQHDSAIRQLSELSRKQPNLAGAFVNLGILYIRQKDYEKAKQALLQATTVNPANAVAHNHLGIAQRELGEFREAEQSYQQALKLKPDYANAHLNVGILYDVYFNDLQRALGHYEKYQYIVGTGDSTVEKWIVDLKHRLDKK